MPPRHLVLAFAALAFACGGAPPPVPVLATQADIRRLAGEWVGEYGSTQTGRAGSIVFTLDSVEDHAHGDVLMGPANRDWSGFDRAHVPGVAPRPTEGQLLSIRFVRAEGDRVSGTIAPYKDPACGCPVQTEFVGRVRADTIAGTFEIRPLGGGGSRTGEWRVVRRRS